jgi:hypothetical protein
MACNHAMCKTCFTGYRKTSLNCGSRCADPPSNVDGCVVCDVFVAALRNNPVAFNVLPARMHEVIWCVELRPAMINELPEMLNDLDVGLDNDFLALSIAARSAIVEYWTERLDDLKGQLHLYGDIARLMDPFQGTDVDSEQSAVTFAELAAPYNPPHEAEISTVPWITEAFRDITSQRDENLGIENTACATMRTATKSGTRPLSLCFGIASPKRVRSNTTSSTSASPIHMTAMIGCIQSTCVYVQMCIACTTASMASILTSIGFGTKMSKWMK